MYASLVATALALALVAPSAVDAHGFVQSLQIGGKTFPGWNPNIDPYASPIPNRIVRKIPDDGPVTDLSSPDLACNKGGSTGAALVAPAAAGSDVTLQWTNWPADHLGPVTTYMASCDGKCTNFNAASAKWFKVDAAGYDNAQWASTRLINAGNKWTSTIPASLKAGEYLLRHEIIALHSTAQAQVYPVCAQLQVTGGGNKVPSGSELVSIPGLYKQSDFPDIWTDSFRNSGSFSIPGPPEITSGSSGASTESATSISASTRTSEAASSTSAPHSSEAASSASSAVTTKATQTTSSTHTSASASAPSSTSTSTGKCVAKRRRSMIKRRVPSHAKRHH